MKKKKPVKKFEEIITHKDILAIGKRVLKNKRIPLSDRYTIHTILSNQATIMKGLEKQGNHRSIVRIVYK